MHRIILSNADLSFSILVNLTHIFNLLSLTNELIEVSLLRHEFSFSFCIFQSADDPSNLNAKTSTMVDMNVIHVQNSLMTKQHVSISNIADLIQWEKYAIDRIKKMSSKNLCEVFQEFHIYGFRKRCKIRCSTERCDPWVSCLLLLGFFVWLSKSHWQII